MIVLALYKLSRIRRRCLSGCFSLLGPKCVNIILAFANRFRLHSASLAHGLQQQLGMPLAFHASFLHHKVYALNREGVKQPNAILS